MTTLFFVMVLAQIGNLVFSGTLFFSKRVFPGAGWWMCGQALVVLGMTMNVILRGWLPPFLSIALANTLVYGGSLCLLDAVCRFRFGQGAPWGIWPSAAVLLILMVVFLDASVNIRVFINSLALGAAALVSGLVLVVRCEQELRLASGLTSMAFFLMVPAHVFRGASALLSPSFKDIYNQGELLPVLYLFTIFSVYLLLFGYFLLASMRHELELRRSNETNLFMMQVIAHDLRNPIQGANRYLQRHLLPEGADLSARRDGLKILGMTLNASSVLLDNLLVWAESRQKPFQAGELETLDLASLLAPALDLCRDGLSERQIRVDTAAQNPQFLADRRMAASVFRNILSNAVRHSPQAGCIAISVREEQRQVFITIADEGPGIGADLLEKLRGGDSLPRLYGDAAEAGNSLGLVLCHRFMASQGGTLAIESELGQGSSFILGFRKPGW